MIERRDFGTLPTGERVDAFTLTNARGLSMRVITYGGIVTHLNVPDRDGKFADVVCGFDALDGYLAGHPYFGCIAGRVAGRITRGRFTLDGVEHSVAINDPPNHLHGGRVGFDKRLWTVGDVSDDRVTLRLVSENGDEGYPGRVDIGVTFSLNDANEFAVDYVATTDAPTPLSLTHHGYFNLAGEGSGSIADHVLQIDADDYAPADEAMTLLGRREPVNANDFRSPRRVGDVLPELWKGHGDVYFVRASADRLAPVATLRDPASGRVMTIRSTEPCVQLYTGVSLDGSLVGKSGRPYAKHGALCLECERYPDGANAPALGDIILRPGETYRQRTVHAFSIDR